MTGSPANVDRLLHAFQARVTGGVSPTSLTLAFLDWAVHLAGSPGAQQRLADKAVRKAGRLAAHAAERWRDPAAPPCIEPLPQDHRFDDPAWRQWPFDLLVQAFLLSQQWWHNATTGIEGVSRHHEEVVAFCARQMLDVASPSNFLPTNPEVLTRTVQEGGKNLLRGTGNLAEDWLRAVAGRPPVGADAYPVGKRVAITSGGVVFRNRLIELIQYRPTTEAVHPEPVLIVTAPIMKYYILDLSPDDSLVRYLVERGHTVFVVSWHNPDEGDRDLGVEDYRTSGIEAALDAVSAIVPDQRVHAVGYCLGGTWMAIAAAALARDGDKRLASLTLFATQTDFTEVGELSLFVDEDQVTYLEDLMWDRGYLDETQMAGAFQLLRSADLLWSRMVRQYLLGEREPMTDLTAWNADGTRLPYRMHSANLRSLFLGNDLAQGRYLAGGRPVSLTDINVPIFSVGAERDHVCPWRSVYKLGMLADTEVTFLLTSGGHNAGIVSPPGHPHRRYRVATHREGELRLDADTWQNTTPVHDGSWWPCWQKWLAERSAPPAAPPDLGAPAAGYPVLGEAPGTYVHET
jgi:polyhydroxyalkanoate synthase